MLPFPIFQHKLACCVQQASFQGASFMRIILRFLLILMPLDLTGALHANGSGDLCDRFQVEYPQAVSKLDNYYRKGLCVKASVLYPHGGEPVNWMVFFSEEKYRVEEDLGSYRAISTVGDRWTFSVAEASGRYELLEMDRNDNTKGDLVLQEVPQLFRPQDFLLPRIVKSKGFRVVSCKEVQSPVGNLVKLEFERIRGSELSRESVLLNANRDWAIHKHEMKMPTGDPFVTEVLYSTTDHLPKELKITLGGKLYRKVIYSEWIQGALPQDPFKPAFYGLPEYSNARSVFTYVIAATLLVVVGAVFVWCRKRR